MVTSRITIFSSDWIHFLNPHFHVISGFHRFFLQTISKKWLLLSNCTTEISHFSASETPFFLPPLTNIILLSFCKDHFPSLSFQPFHLSPHLPSLSTAFLTLQTQAALASPSKPFHDPSPPHRWSLHSVKSSWHLLSIGTQNQPQTDF